MSVPYNGPEDQAAEAASQQWSVPEGQPAAVEPQAEAAHEAALAKESAEVAARATAEAEADEPIPAEQYVAASTPLPVIAPVRSARPRRESQPRDWRMIGLLSLLLLLAAFFRFSGMDWDNGNHRHPDERFVAADIIYRISWNLPFDFKVVGKDGAEVPKDGLTIWNIPPGDKVLNTTGQEVSAPWGILADVDNSPISTRHRVPDGGAGGVRPSFNDFSYGSLPLYLTKVLHGPVTGLFNVLSPVLGKGWKEIDGADNNDARYFLVGRFLSSLADLGTVLLVFLIGRRIYGKWAGLFAAALIAFSVTNIQLAHFITTDSFVTFFVTLTIYFAVRIMQQGGWGSAILAGLALGFAMATKITIVPLAIVIVVAYALRAIYANRSRQLGAVYDDPIGLRPASPFERDHRVSVFVHSLPRLIASVVFTLVGFEIGEPYALFRLREYLGIVGYQNNIMRGLTDVPYTRQYIGTNIFYHPGNLYLWGFGVIAGTVVFAALAFMLIRFAFDFAGIFELLYNQARRLAQRGAASLAIAVGGAVLALVALYFAMRILLSLFAPTLQTLVGGSGDPNDIFKYGIAGLIGLIGFSLLILSLHYITPGEMLLFSAGIPYAALILSLEAKWMRYTLPLVPILALLTAGALCIVYRWARQRWPQAQGRFRVTRVVQAVGMIAVVGGFLWAVAYNAIYTTDHTSVDATNWANRNIPAGAVVAKDGANWEEGFPVGSGVKGPASRFSMTDIEGHGMDMPGPQALQAYKDKLKSIDYIVIVSNRFYGTLYKMPWRYPVATRYYELLLSGKLGFEMVHDARSFPRIFGFEIDDSHADESFTVYDHPRTMIFKKTRELADEDYAVLFGNVVDRPVSQARYNPPVPPYTINGNVPVDKLMKLDIEPSKAPVVDDYAWNTTANDNQIVAIILWLLAIYLLGFLAQPLTWGMFRWLPDRGYIFSKVVALVLVAFFAWLLASLHIAMFSVWTILGCVVLLSLLSGYVWRSKREQMVAWFRASWKLVLAVELVFILSFFFQLWLRSLNPDLWGPTYGGERPMEFSYLNSVLRAPWMPPGNAFFGGNMINYYYYGYVILAVPIKLTGIIPTIAFNLSMALVFALIAAGVASVVYNLIAFSRQRREQTEQPYNTAGGFNGTAMRYGVLATFLTLYIGNIFGGLIALYNRVGFVGDTVLPWFYNLGLEPSRVTEAIQGGYNFFTTTRIYAHGGYMIQEFPYWSFLYGDLHPHMMVIPFALLAGVFALNFAFDTKGTERWLTYEQPSGRWPQRLTNFFQRSGTLWSDNFALGLLTLLTAAINLGSLFVVNSWDFPTYVVVTLGGMLVPLFIRERVLGRNEALLSRPTAILGQLANFGGLVGLSLLAYLPFFINFKVFYSKVGVVPEDSRTRLGEFLVVWGLFVVLAAAYVLLRLAGVKWIPRSLGLRPARSLRSVSGFLAPGFVPREEGEGESVTTNVSSDGHPASNGHEPEAASNGNSHNEEANPTALPVRGTMRVRTINRVVEEVSNDYPAHPYLWTEPEQSASAPAPITEQATGLAEHEAQPVETSSVPSYPWAADVGEQPAVEEERQPLAATPSLPAVQPRPLRSIGVAGLSLALPAPIPLLATLLVLAGAVLLMTRGLPVVGMLALLVGLGVVTLFGRRNDRAGMFANLILLGGVGITLAVELVYLVDFNNSRMNTVFKFYEQAWVLLGMAGAMVLYYIYDGRDEAILADEGRSPARTTATVTLEQSVPTLSPDEPERNEAPAAETTAPASNIASYGATSDEAAVNPLPTDQDASNVADYGAVAATTDPEGDEPTGYDATSYDTANSEVAAAAHNLSYNDGDAAATVGEASPEEAAPIAVKVIPEEPQEPQPEPQRGWWSQQFKPPLGGASFAYRLVFTPIFLVLLLVSLGFNFFGTPSRLSDNNRFGPGSPTGTLDGMAWMKMAVLQPGYDDVHKSGRLEFKYEYEAINWLLKNLKGTPMVVSAPAEYYRGAGNFPSMFTGFPTIINPQHPGEQYYDFQVQERVGDRGAGRIGDGDLIYESTDPYATSDLIAKYGVRYIYVGQIEHIRYDYAYNQANKFDDMTKAGILRKVYDGPDGKVQIYAVGSSDSSTLAGDTMSGKPRPSPTPKPTPTPRPGVTPIPVGVDPKLDALRAASEASPNDVEAHRALAIYYREIKKPDEAIFQFGEAVRLQPDDVASWQQMGDLYMSIEQPDLALKTWETASEKNPLNAAAWNKLGYAYRDRGRDGDAVVAFLKAVNAEKKFAEGWYQLGQTYEKQGQIDAAKGAYRDCIANAEQDNPFVKQAQERLDALK